MNKYTKFLALMSFALVMSACQDDNIISVAPALPGDDIVFGATGYLESGDKGTRTIYGDVYEDSYGKHIQVKWVKGTDRMDIACPQSATAGNVKIAEYKVMDESNSVVKDTLDLDEEIDSIRIEDSSVTATLHRVGNAGLQWSAEDTHHFFASYPSKAMITEKLKTTLSKEEIEKLQLGMSLVGEQNAKLSGYLPVDQTPTLLPDKTTQRGEGKGAKTGWVIEPDMTYAYMVANKTVDTKGNVGLQFTSQMTALEFEIVASDIEKDPENLGDTDPTSHTIKILGVTLSHATNEQIAGHFEYDYAKKEFSNVDIENAIDYAHVTQYFPEGLSVDPKTGFVDVTFFVFPDVTFNYGNDEAEEEYLAKDLELTVIYQVDGIHQNKTAKIRKQIEPKKKYFFANVQLPKIQAGEVPTSNWFNALDDKILFNQVSIPVASNVFANDQYNTDEAAIDIHRKQQTSTLKELWNMGVRGFELCNKSTTNTDENTESVQKENLDAMKMIAAETEFGLTFSEALDQLYECYYGTDEPLILICTYASAGDGYNPQHYICNLFNSLTTFCTRDKSLTEDDFVQLTASTTVKELKGKIAVIIRPGDDERWLKETLIHKPAGLSGLDGAEITTNPYNLLNIESYESIVGKPDHSPYALTWSIGKNEQFWEYKRGTLGLSNVKTLKNNILYKNKWWDHVLLVSDWGNSSWDSWHRRGGTYYKYATTATNYDAIKSAGRVPHSDSKYEEGIITNAPATLTGNYYYAHDMSNGSIAYIQDMTRVVPIGIENMTLNLYYNDGNDNKQTTGNVTWNESLTEKKKAIDGLFEKAVETKGNTASKDIYINVLSSYYPTEWEYKYKGEGGYVSYFPCYDSKKYKSAGLGGDYQSAANDMTEHTYKLLSGTINKTGTQEKLTEGPWGLVMMDYIGDDDVNPYSRKLVNLIVLNNFQFPLAKGDGTGTGGTGGNGGTD